ncbi:MAG TPA: winged helix-turn-helix domain-containing protein [Thermoanaerobaculia bacterium]|nr:winged helix-turn-helix domain-containing protein [Thermoanaerobaculia bacterium]
MNRPTSIGDWEFSPELHLLRRGDLEVRLERKQAEVLAALARRPGEVLTRDELLTIVWSDVHVTEEVLTNAIYELRRVLRDDARKPRYIQTIPRKGYRLVATQESRALMTESRSALRSKSWLLAGAAAAVALLLIVVTAALSSSSDTSAQKAAAATIRAESELDLATGASAIRALELFDQALELEPDSAPARAGRAHARIVLVSRGEISHAFADSLIEYDALRAVRLDPDLADGHAALGILRMLQWDWESAEAHLRRADTLSATSARSCSALAEFLLLAERPDEARRMIARAKELAPDSARVLMASGFIHTMLRDDDIAMADYQRILRRNPEHPEASLQLEKLATREAVETDLDRDELLRRVDVLLRKGEVRPAIVAGMFAEAGETERALEWLGRAIEQKDLSLLLVRLDDRWVRLHSDPRFREVLAEVGPRMSVADHRNDS